MVKTLPNSNYTTISLIGECYKQDKNFMQRIFHDNLFRKEMELLGSIKVHKNEIFEMFARNQDDIDFIEKYRTKGAKTILYPIEVMDRIEERIKWRIERDKDKKEGRITSNPKNNNKNIEDENELIYILKCKKNDVYKIGITSALSSRISSINTSSPYGVEVYSTHISPDRWVSMAIEMYVHSQLKIFNTNGEWFELNERDIVTISNFINKALCDREIYNIVESCVMSNRGVLSHVLRRCEEVIDEFFKNRVS